MFLFNEPSPQRIARFLEAQRDAPFSYDEVGASREGAKAPAGTAPYGSVGPKVSHIALWSRSLPSQILMPETCTLAPMPRCEEG